MNQFIMSIKRSTWCFTLPAGIANPTSEIGDAFEKNGKLYNIIIGPVEKPDNAFQGGEHQHGYIQCPPNTSLTIGQAKSMLLAHGLHVNGEIDYYLKPVDRTRKIYHAYCFKSLNVSTNAAENILKRARHEIEEVDKLKVTAKRLKDKIAATEGWSFLSRHKQLIDTSLAHPEVQRNNKTLTVEIDEKQNLKNYMQAISRFKRIIKKNVKDHGIVTSHFAFEDVPRNDHVNAIICLALLPVLCNRVRVTDNMPALWFHGHSNCGKSYLFSQTPNYKRIATDAEGVSRFKLEQDQNAFLMDDLDPGWLFKPTNSKTLKALTIGERETVKVFGETQEVRGFVVLTSNYEPDHLMPFVADQTMTPDEIANAKKGHLINCNAWRRRIVSLAFDDPINEPSAFIDFDMFKLDIVARQCFESAYEQLKSQALIDMLKQYYDHIHEQWTEDELDMYAVTFPGLMEDSDIE